MFNSLTRSVHGNFSIGAACEIVSNHWDLFESNILLNIDLNRANFVDPSIVGLGIQINRLYPGMFRIINTNIGAQCIIDRVSGNANAGTIFPAFPIGSYIDGSFLHRFQLWTSLVLSRFYGATKRATSSPVELAAIELINNVIDHSHADKGGIIIGASFRKQKHFEITVIDFGDSIPGTLESLHPGLQDEEIIAKALEFGVSRRKGSEHNYGRGLDLVKQYALQDKDCSLQIISRNGFASITNAELPHIRRSRYRFPGTVVKCCFSESFVNSTIEESSFSEELEF